MKGLRLAAIGVCAAAAGLAVAAPGSTAPRNERPPIATVTVAGLTARAALGSYCWKSSSSSGVTRVVCADAAYPLHPHGRLPVHGRDRVLIDTRTRATAVTARLVARRTLRFVGPQMHGAPVGSGGRRWRIRLPRRLDSARNLDFTAQYPRGEADFWAGLARRPCRDDSR